MPAAAYEAFHYCDRLSEGQVRYFPTYAAARAAGAALREALVPAPAGEPVTSPSGHVGQDPRVDRRLQPTHEPTP